MKDSRLLLYLKPIGFPYGTTWPIIGQGFRSVKRNVMAHDFRLRSG